MADYQRMYIYITTSRHHRKSTKSFITFHSNIISVGSVKFYKETDSLSGRFGRGQIWPSPNRFGLGIGVKSRPNRPKTRSARREIFIFALLCKLLGFMVGELFEFIEFILL
jgi:hypothetical protein